VNGGQQPEAQKQYEQDQSPLVEGATSLGASGPIRAISHYLPIRALAYLLIVRIIANSSIRILYPFLPAVARGLGVSLIAASRLASAHGGMRMTAPLLGHLSDRHGRRRVMEIALAMLILATALVFFTNTYHIALFAFAAIGLSRAFFDPTVQAYVGDKVPFAVRGRPFAIISMAWALSWLIGVPISGFIMARWGWGVPWGIIALLLLVALLVMRFFVPATEKKQSPGRTHNALSWWRLLNRPHLRAALLTGFAVVFAVENVLVVYGAYLEDRFALSLVTIGVLSIVMGGSELLAEGGSYLWTDRLGKKRSVIVGMFVFSLALVLLPWLDGNVVLALVGFAFVFFCFEFTIVSFFPLMSEVVPEARGTAISMNVAAMGLARFIAPIVAIFLFQRSNGLTSNALLSAVVALLAAFVALARLPDREAEPG
jgi:predicted MFS family arabinose efflux permease